MREKIDAAIEEAAFLDEAPMPDARLKEDLGLDSLNLVELVVGFEDIFGIQFDESDLDPQEMQMVRDLYQLVAKYMEESEYDI